MSSLASKSVNPFEPDIFELDSRRHRAASQTSIYEAELDELAGLARNLPLADVTAHGEETWGQGCGLFLLRSRRAGFGKTHFLDALAAKIGDDACRVPLRFEPSSPLTWAQLLSDILSSLHRAPAWDGRLNALEDFSRRLFSDMTRELLLNGGIPCANPVQTVAALEKLPPQQVFDFANTSHAIGKWFSRYFEAVLPAARGVITTREALSAEDAGLWLTRLYAYNQPEAVKTSSDRDRLRRFLEPFQKNLTEERARELIGQFCRMMARRRPLVLVVDELDGFFNGQAAIKTLGGLLLGLSRQIPQAMLLLSVNEDLWQSGFSAQLPSAWEDRLTAHVIELTSLSLEDARSLLEQRLLQSGVPVWEASQFLDSLDLKAHLGLQAPGSMYPRALMRHAAAQWRQWGKNMRNPASSATFGVVEEPARPQRNEAESTSGGPAEITGVEETGLSAQEELAPLELEPEPVLGLEPEPESGPESGETAAPKTEATIEAEAEPEAEEQLQPGVVEQEAETEVPSGLERQISPVSALGVREEEPVSEERTADSKNTPGNPPFNRLRDMLERLRQSRGETNVEAMFRESTSADEKEAAPPAGNGLSARYQSLREELAGKGESSSLHSREMAGLLKVLSQGRPVVGYHELDLPTLPGKKVIRWTLEDREILFGCEPPHETRFWKLLSDFTARRIAVREGQGKQGQDSPQGSRLKVVLPYTEEDAFETEDWLRQIEAKPSVSGALQVLHLSRETQLRLLAASRLIQEVSEHRTEHGNMELVQFLAGELDDFWRDITSPVAAKVEQMA